MLIPTDLLIVLRFSKEGNFNFATKESTWRKEVDMPYELTDGHTLHEKGNISLIVDYGCFDLERMRHVALMVNEDESVTSLKEYEELKKEFESLGWSMTNEYIEADNTKKRKK